MSGIRIRRCRDLGKSRAELFQTHGRDLRLYLCGRVRPHVNPIPGGPVSHSDYLVDYQAVVSNRMAVVRTLGVLESSTEGSLGGSTQGGSEGDGEGSAKGSRKESTKASTKRSTNTSGRKT